MRKNRREGGGKGREGKGKRDGRESIKGKGGKRERGREKGRDGKFRGPGRPNVFPTTAPGRRVDGLLT